MHIEEPATHQLEPQLTPQSAQAFSDQGDESGKPVRIKGTHKDITQEKWVQEAVQQQQKRERLLSATLERIYSCSRLEPILQTAVEDVRQFLQTDRTVIYRFHSHGSGVVAFESVAAPLVSLKGMVSIPDRDLDDCHLDIIQECDKYIQGAPEALCRIEPIPQYEVKTSLVIPILLKVEEDEDEDCRDVALNVSTIQNHATSLNEGNPRTRVAPKLRSIASVAAQPKIQNCLWGLLIAHEYRSCRQWQEWEIQSLKQLSRQIAIAIKQCQLFEKVQREIASRQFAESLETEKSQQLEITQAELKYTQGQLLQSEKMANLGQLVANMANEINNPVDFIHTTLDPASQHAEDLIGLVELYQHYYPTPKTAIASQLQHLDLDFIKTDFLKSLWSMQAGSLAIKEIVFALQNFSHFDDGQMRKANLHEGLDSVLRILQHRLKEQSDRPGIQVIKEFGDLVLVECYPGELNQVFMNILTNAIDALEERMKQDYSFTPKIWIRTELVSSHLSLVSSNEAQVIDKRPSKRHKVVIHISDNAKGILPHIQRHIFEPFFTTKPVGKGKGLGLSISQQIIVDKHQGKLKCNSRPGQGTEFVIEMNTKATRYADMRKHALL